LLLIDMRQLAAVCELSKVGMFYEDVRRVTLAEV
jgi:hypothetical protein